jgi:predicted HTH transcriptional regulator
MALIKEGETRKTEFKARLRGGGGSYHLERAVVKAVAGMLNSEGGKLLIGVADDGTVIGLEADYQTLGKQNRDGFKVTLSNLLEARLGVNTLPLIQIDFESVDGRDICVVTADSSTFPVYVKEGNEEKFFVRTHNATRPLEVSEAMEYIEERFR